MPNHGNDEPAPMLLARHRRSGGAHVGYRRVTGIHRAEGLAGPTRRYLFTVALLAGTSSMPILAAIGSGSATVADGMPPAGVTPFIAPPSGGPLVVVPLVPTMPPAVAPGPSGTDDRSLRSGLRPFPVPSGGWLDDAGTSGTEPGRPPNDGPDPNGTGTLPTLPGPTPGQTMPPSPAPSPSPSPEPSPFPAPPVPEPSTSAEPGGPPSVGATGSVEPSPTAPDASPAPTGPSEAAPSAEPTPSDEPTAVPEPTSPPPTPAPSPVPAPRSTPESDPVPAPGAVPAPSPVPAPAAGLGLGLG